MRADRLLSILLLLQGEKRLTAAALARRLEVSERTIYRDMEALGTAGVPVMAERGASGGWYLMEGYETNLTGLNLPELQALLLPLPDRLLTDLGLNRAADAALIKLLAALPRMQRQSAEEVRQRIHVDAAGWHSTDEKMAAFPIVQEALWQGRRLSISYQREEGGVVTREVDPLGLVAKGSIWYLVAAVEEDSRVYRVSRIREANLLGEPSNRPADFDLAAYWEQSSARFLAALPRYPATVRVDPAILPAMRFAGRYARIEESGPTEADGWRTLKMGFQTEESACEYILSFGPRMEVVEPLPLRERVIAQAQATVDFYHRRASR